MAIDIGDIDCTSGMSKRIYDQLVSDDRNGIGPYVTNKGLETYKAQAYSIAKGVTDEINAAGGVGGGGGGAPGWQTLAFGATVLWDLSSGSAALTLTGDTHLATPTNMVAGQAYALAVKQDSVGGWQIYTDGEQFWWPDKSSAVLDGDPDSETLISFRCDGTRMICTGVVKNLRQIPLFGGPSSLGGLVMWLKADSIAQADGSTVLSWPDDSGNGNSMGQYPTHALPVLRLGALNGHAIVDFDPSAGMGSGFSLTDPFTVFVVASGGVPSANSRALDVSSNWLVGPYTGNWKMYDGAFITGPAVGGASAYVACSVVSDTATSAFRVNDTHVGSNANTPNPGTVALGSAYRNEPLHGGIAEVCIFNRALAPAEMDDMHAYLAQKYSL